LVLASVVASAAADAPLVVYTPFAMQSLDELSARCHSGVADCMAKACAAPLKPFGRQPACCANGTAADVCRDTVFSPASDIDYAVQLMYDVYVPCITQHDPRCQIESLLRAVASQCQRQSDAVVAQCQRQSDESAEQIRALSARNGQLESTAAKLEKHVGELIGNQRVLVAASSACQNWTRDASAHMNRVRDDCKRENQVQDIAVQGAFDLAKRSIDAHVQLANQVNERSHATAEKAIGEMGNVSRTAMERASDWLKYICGGFVSGVGIAANATVAVVGHVVRGAVRICTSLSWQTGMAAVVAVLLVWLLRDRRQLRQQLQQQQAVVVAAQPPVRIGGMTLQELKNVQAAIDAASGNPRYYLRSKRAA